MNEAPFTPGPTVQLAVTGTSGRVALGTGAGASGTPQVIVTAPAGGQIAYIKFGDATVAAVAATDTPILPGTVQMFTVPVGATNVAAITATSTQTLYFTTGHGV